MNSTVSIVVPVFNARECIADTIMCVLNQSYTDLELILVDDSSTDDSRKIIGSYLGDGRIKLMSNAKEKGAAGARNTGIEAAGGRYIAFIDADDLWKEDKLEKQVAFMKEKDAAFSFTGYEFADEKGRGLGTVVRVPATITYKEALKNTTIFTSTVMFDTDKLSKDDIYMPYVKSEDTATWWRVLKKTGEGFGIDETLTLYRRSGGTLSANKLEAIRRIWNLYRKTEHLNIFYSIYCFCHWAVRAVARRV
ncbi:MAG: glycosyltransferase [Lachnospiraceae bacterium]|jgi:teichuronic acid biosynthesis glycosyltransferase TuaG|nr:glycosyltransferase [Lachnospiraceae bacterium]